MKGVTLLPRPYQLNVKCKFKEQSNKQYLNQNALLTHLFKGILPKNEV